VNTGTRGKAKYGSDGKVFWVISPVTGTRVLEGEQSANRLLDYMFDGPDAWKVFFESVKTEGIEDVNGRACYKVVFTPNQGSPRINYYDKKSFLLVKQINEAKNQSGTNKIETFFEDYKKSGGILSAHKYTKYVMGQVMEVGVVKRIETNIDMPEGIFDLPEEVKKLISGEIDSVSPIATKYDPSDFPVDLSPLIWGDGELEKYAQLNQKTGGDNPLVEGEDCIVAGTSSPPALRAGLEALKQGGNAMDAALTTSLTQIALEAGAPVSYAGIMTMVYYDSATKKYYNLNAGWNTLLEEDDPLSIPGSDPSNTGMTSQPIPSGRTALVPGYMAGVEAGHKRFGKLPFSSLFSPAVFFAEQGFKLNRSVGSWIFFKKNVLSRLPETKAVFTKKDGSFYMTGDIFLQPELAKTLRRMAKHDASYMYIGE
jgi:hypothetical protein